MRVSPPPPDPIRLARRRFRNRREWRPSDEVERERAFLRLVLLAKVVWFPPLLLSGSVLSTAFDVLREVELLPFLSLCPQ